MKNKLLVLLMVAVMGIMTACGNGGGSGSDIPVPTEDNRFYYAQDDKRITIGDKAEEVLEKLGAYTSEFTSVSCAFEGEDHFYVYGSSLQICTSQVKGKEVLTSIQLLDDLVETPEGIKIGDSAEAVAKAYKATDSNGVYTMKCNVVKLTIVTKNGEVISITYSVNEDNM